MRITPTVHMVGGGGLTHPGDCCIYLVEAEGKLIMVDAGTGESHGRLCDNISSAGFDISNVDVLILTHGHIDHIGGARAVKEASGCAILAHEGDSRAIEGYDAAKTAADAYGLEYRPVGVDKILCDGDDILPDTQKLKAIHAPGHTPGSLAIIYRPGGVEATVLFGQDIHGPFHEEWGSDMNLWRASMKRLISLDADVLCEGHYGVIRPRERVGEFIQGFL